MRLIVEVEPDGTLTWTTGSWPVANPGTPGQRLQDQLCETCRSDFLQALQSVASGRSPHERIEHTQLLGAGTHLTATLIPVIEGYAVIRVLVVFAHADATEADFPMPEHEPAHLRARRVDEPSRSAS